MKIDKRKNQRFLDMGKVEALDLCPFPGVFVDVSKEGCRVRFPTSFLVNTDTEFEMKISPVRFNCYESFLIIVRPIWQKNTEDSTEIGFNVLHSPDFRKFDNYVEKLIEEKKEIESEEELLDGIEL